MTDDPVQASDELDELLRGDLKAQGRYGRTTRLLLYLVAALALIGGLMAVRVDRNSRQIDRTNDALRVFCDQTNRGNAEARAKFAARFAADAPDPQALNDFLEVAWPLRDCSQVSSGSGPATSTTQGDIP